MVERINYNALPNIAGPYVHATKHDRILYVSGLTAFGTPAQSEGLPEQCAQILSQISSILEFEQRRKQDIIKLTIFVRDITLLTTIREQLFEFYEGFLPACSLVEVSKLIHLDLLIEIEATVALDD